MSKPSSQVICEEPLAKEDLSQTDLEIPFIEQEEAPQHSIHFFPEQKEAALPDELLTTSYAIIGKKKSTRSTKDAIQRRKKTFVEKAFLELVMKLKEEEIQSLLYLNLYDELCCGISLLNPSTTSQVNIYPTSPYFIGEAPSKHVACRLRHVGIKRRIQKTLKEKTISILPLDHFQLACTLCKIWEQALRIVEHRDRPSSTLFKLAEDLVVAAKKLPDSCNPMGSKKTLIHISSFKMSTKGGGKRLKPECYEAIKEFAKNSLLFGYEYFGIA